jgi:hypothetical protein
MNLFIATAVVVAMQWPGPWTPEQVSETAQTIHAETLAGGEYIVTRTSTHVCVEVEGLRSEPWCEREIPSEAEIIRMYESALEEVLLTTGQL